MSIIERLERGPNQLIICNLSSNQVGCPSGCFGCSCFIQVIQDLLQLTISGTTIFFRYGVAD